MPVCDRVINYQKNSAVLMLVAQTDWSEPLVRLSHDGQLAPGHKYYGAFARLPCIIKVARGFRHTPDRDLTQVQPKLAVHLNSELSRAKAQTTKPP